jgi:hypothetical protein
MFAFVLVFFVFRIGNNVLELLVYALASIDLALVSFFVFCVLLAMVMLTMTHNNETVNSMYLCIVWLMPGEEGCVPMLKPVRNSFSTVCNSGFFTVLLYVQHSQGQ